MDSPQSDDEKPPEAEAGAEEAMLSKKMKLLIIMLSLVLIILLLPLAGNYGLPLLQPMGISMLQRLWDAMRFIAMTAAISVGIISTSSQKNDKGHDRSAHRRSTSSIGRSSISMASSSSSRETNSPHMIDSFDVNQSVPISFSAHREVNDDLRIKERRDKEMGNVQKLKGKEVMDEFSAPASSGDASSPSAIGEEGIYGLRRPSRHAIYPRQASNQEEMYWQGGMSSRHGMLASDAWLCALRIDEEKEEEPLTSASPGFSSGNFLQDSKLEAEVKSLPTSDKGIMRINKETKSGDRGIMNAYASMTDDNYAELRMRKAAISRLVDENQDASTKGHRRSSSVDRRRPIYYDDQGPDRPGLKQILMDVSKERAANYGKRSNLSSSNRASKSSLNAGKQLDRPHSAQASTSASLSLQQLEKVSTDQPLTADTLPESDLNRTAKHSGALSMAVEHRRQQEAIRPEQATNKTSQKQIIDNKLGPNQKTQSPEQGTMPLNKVVLRQDDHQVDAKTTWAYVSHTAGSRMASSLAAQTHLHNDASMMMGTQGLHHANDEKGPASSAQIRARKPEEDLPSTLSNKAEMPARSKLLLQSSKHSRSALNFEQLEQIGSRTVHASSTPPAGPSARRKKSYSCDFGDGFNPEWLWKLEPPPPPGFSDQATAPPVSNQGMSLSSAKPDIVQNDLSSALVQNLLPWRSTAPIDISAYPRAASPLSPPDVLSHASPAEVNRRADEFISNFTTRLMRQRQESLERQKRYE